MKLKKMFFGLALAGTMLFGVQAASACSTSDPDPYDCSWILQEGFDNFGVSIYTPVENGLMFITGQQGSIELAIDTKTYPDFQPIYILEENSAGIKYYASEDQSLGTEDVLLGSQPIFDISFKVAGVDKEYSYYDGSSYTGLQLLKDDYTKFGLVKITNVDPITCDTPIPGAAWLLGTGLVGLIGLRKRKK